MPSPAERRPLGGRAVGVRGCGPAATHARDLVSGLGGRVEPGTGALGTLDVEGSAAHDWAQSGAMSLTGSPDGPPLAVRGAPASALRAALLVFELLTRARGADVTGLPGVSLLGERAAASGWTRNAPFSVAGAFRFVQATDGWLGVNLARPSDLEALPAVVEGDVGAEVWAAVQAWAGSRTAGSAAERAQLLGVPAAALAGASDGRPPVTVRTGGRREPRAVPLVVDLTSLWAGPLCAHLLGLGGCRVVKVESTGRPDGARRGATGFYDLLHSGHESVALDFTDADDRARLRDLLAAADVVLESSRPRALQQLGIEAEEHVAEGATWASITAYGRTGAWSDRVGLGDDVAGAAGLVADHPGEPWPAGDALADPLAGAHAAAAVSAALLGGGGFLLDVSMCHVAAAAAALPGGACTARRRDEQWWVDDVVVAAPRARSATGHAAALGADTTAVLAELT